MTRTPADNYDVLISEAQLRRRIATLGRQISHDYEGREIQCIGVLDNGFIFVADLVRAIQGNIRCQFIKSCVSDVMDRNIATTQIFYTPEVEVEGKHILLCEGILSTGQTTDFLVRNFQARGAASIAICAFLDRLSDRRVDVDIAYYGFQVGRNYLSGFGFGSPTFDRNLPYIFATPDLRLRSS